MFDQQPEQGFRLPRLGGGDGGFEVVGDGGEFGRVGQRRGLWGELLGEVGVLLAEDVEARLEGGHARLETLRVQFASLEPGVVADERPFGAARLFGERSAPLLECRLGLLRLRGRCIERVADKRAVAVEGGELVDDGGFELVAGDAFAVAAFAPQFLSAGAGVVVVEAAVAPCTCADVGAAAAAAADEPGEQVVAGVAAAQRHVFAAFAQEALRALEGELVDERLVEAGHALAAPEHTAEVGLVLQNELDGCGLPACGWRRCLLVHELARDRGGAEPA